MKKTLFIFCFLLFLSSPGCAETKKGGLLNGLFTAKVADEVKLADRVTGLEAKIQKLAIDLQTVINAQAEIATGINNKIEKISTDIKAGRDAYTNSGNTNQLEIFQEQTKLYKYQTKVWKNLFMWLGGLIMGFAGIQSGRLWWVTKRLMKEASDARYYQVEIARRSDAKVFDEVMKAKRDRDNEIKQKKLVNKVLNAGKAVGIKILGKEVLK